MEYSSHADPAGPDLILVNPVAGGGHAAEILPDLQEFARQRSWNVEICVTQDSDDLATRARKAAEAGRKNILVLGGDGTFHVLLNATVDYPETILGVLPAGGGNDLALALGLPQDPVQAAALILEGETCRLDLARVRTAEGKVRLYIGGGGVGLDAEAARLASGTYRQLRGRLRYLLAAIHALFGFHAIGARIRIIGSEPRNLEVKALLVGVLNTPSYGGGVCLAPGAKTDDGILELVVLDDLSLGEILAQLPTLLFQGALKTKRLRRFSVERVRIETDTPCWFHGDGELLGMTPVEISVVPLAVRVLCAPRKVAR
ncbi:MAG: diacylglycerol kinase family protein [Candidatus Acidiferrum sp.]